jgi:tRNA threonylcarbamoyladenosine biosynthesis protein TsaB
MLCHAGGIMLGSHAMPASRAETSPPASAAKLLLGVDTCGPSGSVALARLTEPGGADLKIEILGQLELEGRSYSATLVAAVGDLLTQAGLRLKDASCIVAVNGPGSFTGVRVGLAAVKGLAEPAGTPIVAVSRLEVLAAKAGLQSSALDAHRSEVFLRLALPGKEPIELLAGAAELAEIASPPAQVAICDGAATLLQAAWASVELVRVPAPTAADALHLAARRVAARDFADPVRLDGNYLRRSDAEIFGEPARLATRQ